jgi:hypothetical protein
MDSGQQSRPLLVAGLCKMVATSRATTKFVPSGQSGANSILAGRKLRRPPAKMTEFMRGQNESKFMSGLLSFAFPSEMFLDGFHQFSAGQLRRSRVPRLKHQLHAVLLAGDFSQKSSNVMSSSSWNSRAGFGSALNVVPGSR